MWEGEFWASHWWLIIVLAVFAMPILSILTRPFGDYIRYRRRRDALDVLKVYAQQGKEPPAEVLEALRPTWGWGREWPPAAARRAADTATNAALDATGAGSERHTRRDERRAERWARQSERWERGQPWRRWNGPIFMGSLAVGFGLASQYAPSTSQNVFLLVAIISGALAAAGVISALLATFMKVD